MPSTSGIHYDFLSPGKIVFGWGRRSELGSLASGLGRRAFLVWGSQTVAAMMKDEIAQLLTAAKVEPVELMTLSREPLVEDVDAAAYVLREAKAGEGDIVIAIGGGSAIDLAKAAAAMATNRGGATVADYLEGVGRGLTLSVAPLPIIAMPTTAGTGAEATKNAVISSVEPQFKKSLRADGMMPRVALIDPELGVTTPPAITAQCGMDAITQLIESYISRRAKPIPRALAAGSLKLAMTRLPEAVRDGSSRPAREAMAHAALISGMALANSGLGMAHGVAAALGAVLGTPHGLACAVMLPVALRTNRAQSLRPLADLAETVGVARGSEEASAAAFIERIEALCDDVGVPRSLRALGARREHLPALVAASRGNSMDGNPRTLDDAELLGILEALL